MTEFSPQLLQVLTDFRNLSTGTFCEKYATKSSVRISLHVKSVAIY